MSDEKKTVLSMRHINKTFPGVKALSDAQLTLREGEIHALMGENGARAIKNNRYEKLDPLQTARAGVRVARIGSHAGCMR